MFREQKKFTLDYLRAQLPKAKGKLVNQDVVDELNELVKDPDYGQEFLNSVITHTSTLTDTSRHSMQEYLNAIKYYSLTSVGHTLLDAYIKVFPDRLQARLDRGQVKEDIRSEANRFNRTELVNAIKAQALIPLHLVNQETVQKAINQLSHLMMNARSDVAKVSAATAILKELRPPEVQQMEIAVGLNEEAQAAQAAQNDTLAQIAINQQKLLAEGHSIEDVQKIHMTKKEYVDVEIDDE